MHLLFQPPDGLSTISDLWNLFEFLLYLPGNILISWIYTYPDAAHFFEIGYGSGNGTVSFYVSAIIWGAIYLGISALCSDKPQEHYHHTQYHDEEDY